MIMLETRKVIMPVCDVKRLNKVFHLKIDSIGSILLKMGI